MPPPPTSFLKRPCKLGCIFGWPHVFFSPRKYSVCLYKVSKICWPVQMHISPRNNEVLVKFLIILICCTLRSWVHAIFYHYRSVSPRLRDNYMSKCSSDNFPHKKYTSPCVENCQNNIAMHCWSPIAGRRSWNREKKNGTNLSHNFPCF